MTVSFDVTYERNISEQFILKSTLLVGCGNWGKNLARILYEIDSLHTICDSNVSLLDSFKNLYSNINITNDYVAALKDNSIRQVIIAAPAYMHYSLAEQALNAGKDVYVEKPFCLETVEGEKLVALAKKKEAILMVGHLLQYHPCVEQLQKLVIEGELGELQYIASSRLNLGSIRTEENVLWSFSPHDISVILSLCNQDPPTKVRCIGESYLNKEIFDRSILHLIFKNNVKAHIHASWLHPFKEQKMVVVGSKAMAVFDDLKPWHEKLAIYREHIDWSTGVPRANKIQPEYLFIQQSEPLKNECLHFLECCRTRQQPRTNGEEGLRVLQVLQAAQMSLSKEGEMINIESNSQSPFFHHSTAIIDPAAKIGEGTKIWHFSHIMNNAEVGTSCNIGQNVVISPGVVLGSNVKVQNNVSVYTGVICEDHVFLGPSVVFTNVLNPRSEINRRNDYQKTLVRQGATIGANATIVCGIELGEYCFIGAGAVVVKNVKPYALVVGNPSRQIGWMSRCGERLDLPVEFHEEGGMQAKCPSSGKSYLLKNDTLTLLD